jgi:hypothetical protein
MHMPELPSQSAPAPQRVIRSGESVTGGSNPFHRKRHVVQLQSLDVSASRPFGSQLSLDRFIRFEKLFHQFRTNGEQIAPRQLEDLTGVAKTCAHDFCLH